MRQRPPTYVFNGWRLVMSQRSLFRPDGSRVRLTSNEIDVLGIFCANAQHVMSAQDISALPDARYIHMVHSHDNLRLFIHRLRRALESFGTETPLFINVRNRGYLFAPHVTVDSEGTH